MDLIGGLPILWKTPQKQLGLYNHYPWTIKDIKGGVVPVNQAHVTTGKRIRIKRLEVDERRLTSLFTARTGEEVFIWGLVDVELI